MWPVVTGRAFVSDEMPSPTPPCRAQPRVLRGHRPVARATGGKWPLVGAVLRNTERRSVRAVMGEWVCGHPFDPPDGAYILCG